MEIESPKTIKNRLTVPLCFMVAMCEGIDVQSAGVAAPKLAAAFHFGSTELGQVFSSCLFGMFLGAIVGGRIADAVGPKRVLVFSMYVFCIFSLGTAAAEGKGSLLAMRFLTGLGLGGAMPNIFAMTAEASREVARSLALTVVFCGLPLGGAIVSLVALLGFSDWRAIFYVGAAAPLIVAPLIIIALQESRTFEVMSLDLSAANTTELAAAATRRRGAMASLFGRGCALTTLILWTASFLTLMTLFLLINWLPTLLIGKGLNREEASLVQIVFNVGGASGSVLAGALLDRHARARVVSWTYATLGISLALMAWLHVQLTGAAVIALFIGAAAIAAQAVIFAIAPEHYAVSHRSTGIGAVVAAGRLGSIFGPLVAGILLNGGDSAERVFLQLLPVIACAGLSGVAMVAWLRPPRD
jgi:MFS transporter, AAHS family, 3-hydroxyphenylpropionic acid transporter